jgi:parvulin-like peptidyl-prolyl isomerase
MAWCGRLFGVCTVLVAGLWVSGCVQAPATLPTSRDTPFSLNVPDTQPAGHISRSQQPDPSALSPRPPTADLPPPPPNAGGPPTPGIVPVGLIRPGASQPAVQVRAWVNGKPIFADEVINAMSGHALREVYSRPPAERDAELERLSKLSVEALIDQELLYQDGLRMLQKNLKYLEKIKTAALKETEKRIKDNMKANGLSTTQELEQVLVKQGTTLQSVRHQMEREFIANEYLKVRIYPLVNRVGHEEIRDYYDQHLNEFQRLDRVKWQDIFVAVGPKHATLALARQFAEQLIERWRAGEDISKLLEFDDGESRFRKGEGVGEIKGSVKPRELEEYLFVMKEGEFGPPVELSTGVHIFRLLKREHAGLMPFDDKVQTMIANKLKNEIVERERRRFVRDLRERAFIEIERKLSR